MTTSLADHLRALPDESLAALLQLRPDLVVPVPADVSALALRAQSRVSVARALDGLDQFTLQILDAARLTRGPEGATSTDQILAMATAGPRPPAPTAVRAAVDRLRARFLLYGPEHDLCLAGGIDEVSPYPAGLGRPAAELDPRVAALCADPAKLRRTLLSAPPSARAVLDRLAAGPPVGTVAPGALEAPATGAEDVLPPDLVNGGAPTGSPIRWLVEHRLLVRMSGGRNGTVELPREVGLVLRRDSGPLGPLRTSPPVVSGPPREVKSVDSAGAGQTMEVVRHTEALLEALIVEPAPVLRSGGIGVRDLRRLARGLGLDETTTALLFEVAYAAGLTGEMELTGAATTRYGGDQQILPTGGYEVWRAASLAQRWEQLARAWMSMPRQAGLIGQRDDRDRPISVLSAEAERAGAPAARRAVLAVLADLPAGTAPTPDEVLELLDWRAPRRARGRETAHREVLAEAASLGVTGLGALTTYGRLLLAELTDADERGDDPLGLRSDAESGDPSTTVRALDGLLPAPVDHVLVQADLTVVVPGPPDPALAAELDVVAEHESAGGASVHRVTTGSIRRALDAGYTAEDLHALFRRRSRTPVPQGLTYLVDDVARKHGGLRVGSSGAYVRSDDEALLTEVQADRRLEPLAFRRLAPTVLVTPYQVNRMLTALRDAGYAPVPEDASGATVLARPKTRRAPARTGIGRAVDPLATPKLPMPRLLGVVEQIRRGDAAARAARRAPAVVRGGAAAGGPAPVPGHGDALAVLQQAVRDKALVWVGYVDAHGATASRLVRPVSIGAGYLRAEDDRTEMLHTFALHRITAAVLEE
ncbi:MULTISPECIES: helicase-associated domain-containing protein [unclassified Micromonospora]|uniref:helicase-associated domain-containing protein n=1 Tax=unclassified Micromonospora TaxID=2617518 RepID=UPI00112CFE02|nr:MULTISPECIES: helicase-associated domain-containing protein [unclassified Micromonospora]MCK1809122.1 helicase C-terminal domain-containing protein [Micromonospora sp. R42106]MCK1833732.1 helicase C-terminal domain-containing protein [Micromonospora sp. R42003]MCK1845707.1 helicase C-terminal domain-containing protein [Micromonospora sp. R42004]